jgi:hypothetical protein
MQLETVLETMTPPRLYDLDPQHMLVLVEQDEQLAAVSELLAAVTVAAAAHVTV